jgi:predicted AlkP superfamily phosphohydrolase/phosphomutase
MRALIIGLDGATWDYIDPLLAQGALPNLETLTRRGVRAMLHSTRPPYTNVAWPSLVTGLSPAKMGVFDGARRKPGGYDFLPSNLTGYRGVPIWHWVNRFGLRAGVLNVPMTYPASPLDGYMVTGFDSPRRSPRIAYPPDLLRRWADRGHLYRVLEEEADLMDHQNPHQRRLPLEPFLRRWERLTLEQGDMVAWLWEADPVDLLFVVFSVTDSVNHRTRDWAAIQRAYVAVDRALGRMLEAVAEDVLICLVSDHGSTPAYRYIALYRVLLDAGWLRFQAEVSPHFWTRLPGVLGRATAAEWKRLPVGLRRALSWPLLRMDGRLAGGYENVEWGRTRVFARTAMGPLYINLTGRFPQGNVLPGELAALKAEVSGYLEGLRDEEGRPLFARVWDVAELYPDAHPEDEPPDLLAEPARWSDHLITGYPTDPVVRPIPPEREYGTHTLVGMLLLAGPGIREGHDLGVAEIVDVVSSVLAAVGLPVPSEADGRVLEAAFENPPWVEKIAGGLPEVPASGEEGSEEVLARLRALGYLE